MKIATGDTSPAVLPKSSLCEDSQNIRFTDWTRADRAKRQVIAAIESLETVAEVEDYVSDESLLIDALYMFDPIMADGIAQAEEDHKAILSAGAASMGSGAPETAQSPTTTKQEKIVMFATNQTEGSQGPWMTWSSNGSAAKGFAPKSWVMRGKDANDNKFEQVFEGFANPCVFDLDSLKLGWEKDGMQGQAPDRRYSSHYSVELPRPDESKKQNGAYTWSNCLQVRVATSQTQAVTWEQGSFGAYQAFVKLSRLIETQWTEHSQNGALLPVVQMTGVEERSLSSGSTNIPILEIVKWVPRPDILKDDAPKIATPTAQASAPNPAPVQTPPPAAQPDNSAVSAAGGF